MLGLWIALGVIAVLVIILVVWGISTYNKLIKMKNDVEESFSTMDVCMKKRYDLVPNLVATVKGYAKHEESTLEKVIAARNMAVNATSMEEKSKADNMLTGTLKSIFALSESYPELKANTNFMDLQNQLKNLETEISNSRKYYNACVKNLNNKIEVFPSSIIAKWFKFEKKTMFEVDAPEERKNVKVEF